MQLRARLEGGQVVVDAQGPRRAQGQVEPRPFLERGRLGGRPAGREELRGQVVAAGPEGLPHVDAAGDPLFLGVAEQVQIDVDLAPQPLGVAQAEAAAGGPEVEGGQPAPRVGGLALDLHAASAHRARDPHELRGLLVEAHAPAHLLDPVGEAAHADPGPVEVQGAVQARGGARPRHREGEPGRPPAAEARADHRERAQVGGPPRVHREVRFPEQVHVPLDREIGSLGGDVQRGHPELPVLEGGAQGLAVAQRVLRDQHLEVGEGGFRREGAGRNEGTAERDLAGGHEAEGARQGREGGTQIRVEAGVARLEAEGGLVRR